MENGMNLSLNCKSVPSPRRGEITLCVALENGLAAAVISPSSLPGRQLLPNQEASFPTRFDHAFLVMERESRERKQWDIKLLI
ncbi:hypothetical protein NPIL_78981 [Nephila pilipes]|uniref:Uncharacterized protein n=1 Tax=Nephila pilipes TaxID=299642 RepID=A0A8X6Q302_NEPPI|nr:hypothetical protein NPIL_78981 [Nephila pilipes]